MCAHLVSGSFEPFDSSSISSILAGSLDGDVLNFSGLSLTAGHMGDISNCISQFYFSHFLFNVRTLSLQRNLLTNEAGPHLGAILQSLPSLTSLDLSHNKIKGSDWRMAPR